MRNESVNRRFLEYRNILKKISGLGFTKVFSSNLADSLGISSSLVRKDFLSLSTVGNKRGGYQIKDLLNEINGVLRKDREIIAALVGVGKLGSALLSYQGFSEENIRIAAAFDNDTDKINENKAVPIYHIDKFPEIIARDSINIAVLAVPAGVAQRTADMLILSGIKGILNFAPVRLILPKGCYENQINLAIELERVALQVG